MLLSSSTWFWTNWTTYDMFLSKTSNSVSSTPMNTSQARVRFSQDGDGSGVDDGDGDLLCLDLGKSTLN